ncbi:hypothetical protein GCM10023219_18960 [Stakelama sediminis]
MLTLRHSKFAAYMAALVVGLGLIQLAASVLFYQSIDRQTLRNDHARRIAELLVVSERLYLLVPGQTPETMSTRFLNADVSEDPRVDHGQFNDDLSEITREIERWEPGLAGKALRLARVPNDTGRDDLVGSIRLPDNRWLNFRSRNISSMWPVAARAIVLTIVSTALLIFAGLTLLHRLARPLRSLANAADTIGEGRQIAIEERGPKDLRGLASAMNLMQSRIAGLLREQAQSFEAISHDLRTPLSRQKLVADLLEDPELSAMLVENVDEMEDLLASLQQFLRAQHLTAQAEPIDLTSFVRAAIIPLGEAVSLRHQDEVTVTTFVEPLRISLALLLENAQQYGRQVEIGFGQTEEGRWIILIDDDGPGLSEEHFQDILDPFFRLDQARSRNTKGFGLGIPTAHRLMTRFNGGLSFGKSALGGLRVIVTVPTPSNHDAAILSDRQLDH